MRHLALAALFVSVAGTFLACSYFPFLSVEGWRVLVVGLTCVVGSLYAWSETDLA